MYMKRSFGNIALTRVRKICQKDSLAAQMAQEAEELRSITSDNRLSRCLHVRAHASPRLGNVFPWADVCERVRV